MDKAQVIAHVAGDLNATEQALDEAIVRATALVQSMIGARTQLGISPVAGTASQAKAMETIAALSAAREAVVACHTEMAKDHRRLGYGVFASGGINKGGEYSDDKPTGQLRVA